jgi:hypothetical protein
MTTAALPAATDPATAAPTTPAPARAALAAVPAVNRAAATGSEAGPRPVHEQPPGLRILYYEPEPERRTAPQPATAPARRPHVVPVERTDPGDLRRHLERVLRLAFEVLDGRRPLAQLAPHLTPGTARYLRAAIALRPPMREPTRMTSLHVGRPRIGVAEVAAVYRRGPRARVVAARFERGRTRSSPARGPRSTDRPEWRCVALRLL